MELRTDGVAEKSRLGEQDLILGVGTFSAKFFRLNCVWKRFFLAVSVDYTQNSRKWKRSSEFEWKNTETETEIDTI